MPYKVQKSVPAMRKMLAASGSAVFVFATSAPRTVGHLAALKAYSRPA
jgi:hypothetical protein